MTDKTKHQLADEAADLVAEALANIQGQTGMPTECLLAGAHAQIIAMMVMFLGGPMTALSCEQASARVRRLPSKRAVSLAFARPAGRA